jgi:tetratricopeptide (TPR) repeat protein
VAGSELTRRPDQRLLTSLLLAICVIGFITPAWAQRSGRVIDIIDAVAHDDHVNINIQFNCTMRYISHMPANVGTETQIRFRPGPDCGLGAAFSGISDLPSLAGVQDYVKELRVEDGAPGEVNVLLTWQKQSTYVMASTGDQRGFAIRLIFAPPKGHAYIQETVVPDASFAVNLESSQSPFGDEQIASASKQFKTPAYVSKIVLDGATWYRLRVGPIASRNDAEQLLTRAQTAFPHAWLVIGEDEDAGPGRVDAKVPPAAQAVSDPPLPDADRVQLMAKAKAAMAARDFKNAVEILTTLVRQPEYGERADAQELLGLARERSGQLAHAKAEYEEYLRRYPRGPAADRIRARLKALALAGRRPRSMSAGNGIPLGWTFAGGFSQLYRRDQNNITSTGISFKQTSENAIINNGDFLARRRGDDYDFLGRLYAGYTKNMLKGPNATGDQTQLFAAFAEITDKKIGMTGRLGRQSRGSGGIFGTFDGAWVSYKVAPRVTISTTFGYPVDSLNEGVRTNREFAGLSADFGTFFQSMDFSTYVVEQKYDGHVDRRAIGVESRYFQPGRSLIALIDYDVMFKSLNSATVIGGVALPASCTLSFNFDHRDTPLLTLRNSLIGQPVGSINALLEVFTSQQVTQLARDRTARSDVYAVTLTRPIAERFQVSADVYLTKVGATPASGNVPAGLASGSDRALQIQLFGTSLWRPSDLHVLSLRYDTNPTAVTESIGLNSRMPIWANWRIGPRVEIERIRFAFDQSSQMNYIPALRLERQRSRSLLEFEVGADRGSRQLQFPADTQTSTHLYFSAGYRLGF